MAITYTWAVLRERNGIWSHQVEFGQPGEDPRGIEDSDEDPYTFVRALAARLQLEGRWRIAVWDTTGVGGPPVAALQGGQ